MIHKLNELLAPMQDKNVSVIYQFNDGFLGNITTANFDYEVNELYLVFDNNCDDCSFDFKIPLYNIESANYDKIGENDDCSIVVIELKNNCKIYIALI